MASRTIKKSPEKPPASSLIPRFPSLRRANPLSRDVIRFPSLSSASDLSRSQSLRNPFSYRGGNILGRQEVTRPTIFNTRSMKTDEGKLEEEEDVTVVNETPPAVAAPKVTRAVTFRCNPPFAPMIEPVAATSGHNPNAGLEQIMPELQLHRTLSAVNAPASITSQSVAEFVKIVEERIATKILTFPSVSVQKAKGGGFVPGWNWLKQYKRLLEESETLPAEDRMTQVRSFYSQVSSAKCMVEQIRLDFEYGIMQEVTVDYVIKQFGLSKPGERGRMILNDGSIPYVADIFASQLKAQVKYESRIKPLTRLEDRRMRNNLVESIVSNGIVLKYAAETTHLAVYLVDAFISIKGNAMSFNGWPLLGITALHLAAKLEEPDRDRAKVYRLIRLFNQNHKPEDVYWMERNILSQLQFDVYPPLAPFLAKLVLMGGSLDLPSPDIAKLVMDLSQGILFKSLTSDKLSSVRASERAQAALEIAVEYIFVQYKFYSRRDLSRYELVTSEPGGTIGEFAVGLCFDLFLHRFTHRRQPSTVQSMVRSPAVASPARNVKV